jgi:hypothetical protein
LTSPDDEATRARRGDGRTTARLAHVRLRRERRSVDDDPSARRLGGRERPRATASDGARRVDRRRRGERRRSIGARDARGGRGDARDDSKDVGRDAES